METLTKTKQKAKGPGWRGLANFYMWQNVEIKEKYINFATGKQESSNMKNHVATNLKKLREAARYTQDEVAQALGITRSAYSNYESGEREAPYDVLEKVANLFGCEMLVLFDETENADAMILASAFRLDGLTEEDSAEIIRFKDIVKSYLKMSAIEAR